MASSIQPPKHAQNVRFSFGSSSVYQPVGLSCVFAIAFPLMFLWPRNWAFACIDRSRHLPPLKSPPSQHWIEFFGARNDCFCYEVDFCFSHLADGLGA